VKEKLSAFAILVRRDGRVVLDAESRSAGAAGSHADKAKPAIRRAKNPFIFDIGGLLLGT
jgi:hypothetical protein